MRPRVVPTLLLKAGGLYKTRQFKSETYVGDPINAVRIFNDKEADELALIDIGAARRDAEPDLELLSDISGEAFMPMSYGGGVGSCEVVHSLITCGYERVIVNSAAIRRPNLVSEIVDRFGTSTLIGAIDTRRDRIGRYHVYIQGGQERTKLHPVEWARRLAELGVGEILVNSIDRDGEMGGYDLPLLQQISASVPVPVIAAGGAGSLEHFRSAVESGAAAVAAGSYFVFHGKHRAVLISYPTRAELVRLWPEGTAPLS